NLTTLSRPFKVSHFRSLGGRRLNHLVFNILRLLMTDELAAQMSLRGATRQGKSKKSFSSLGLLPIIANAAGGIFKDATAVSVGLAVAEHLRHAGTRVKKQSQASQQLEMAAGAVASSSEESMEADDEDDFDLLDQIYSN
uniref:VPS13_C domain-containing protein n=1 Tax=Macrostomum lignano TaxID=282301 RepID=A0A1I8GH15_9PLAT